MKKLFPIVILVILSMAALSCSRETEVDGIVGQELTINAVLADAQETRTALQTDGTSVWWTTGERINAFYGSLYGGMFTSTNTQPAALTTFQGTLTVLTGSIEDGSEQKAFWAVYPYNASNTCDGSSVTLTVPSSQQCSEGTFADKLFPAVATGMTLNLAFYNVCGGACFSVVNEGITAIAIRSNGGEPLVGQATVGFGSDGKPVLKRVTNGNDVIILTAPNGGFIPGKRYYAAILPRTFSLGFTISFLKGNENTSASVSLEKSISVNRARFGVLNEVDKDAVFKEGGSSEFGTLSVSPEELTFENSSGSQVLFVSSDREWTVTRSASWISVSPTSGSGNGMVQVDVSQNTGEKREGAVSFKSTDNLCSATIKITQEAAPPEKEIVPILDMFDGTKRASTTYQLLIYSFADSDGDGIGDFKGIQNKLDYLDGLGVTALWLSPAHPASSYHGYDVTDYYTVNPLYGTEADFKNLVDAAHAKGIKIYMDYVLNHTGKEHPWFQQALADPSSPYRDYYFISSNPSTDYASFPMLQGTTYQSSDWKQATSGSPKLTISKTNEAVTTGNSDWNLWFWTNNSEGETIRFVENGDGSYYLVMDISGKCGMLVRKYMNWDAGSKYGASGNGTLTEYQPLYLVADGNDISFTGYGRYKIELTNVDTETVYYMGSFSGWMPDLNYGNVSQAENNECFQDMASSADKWINLGVDGFRLDAVKHICGGINSYNNTNNQILLKKWYDHCNATYRASGHTNNIFMVAEAWDSHNTEMNYYKGVNSCFEFDYFSILTNALKGNASNYVSTVNGFISDHTAVRSDAITSIFMTNHDQDRAAESLSKNLAKEKQAAAMMLTTPGKPFIYQGEELGYWGTKNNGDEYVRTPIMWDKTGKDCAKNGVNNKVNTSMLTSSISVEAQNADDASLLSVYKIWSRLRNTYSALADGTMTDASLGGDSSIAAWYMTSGSQKLLVIHNTSSSMNTLTITDDTTRPVALLGTATLTDNVLKLGANSSVVFKVQ